MEISKICFDQAKALEDYCGFLPIRKGTKAPLVSYKNETKTFLKKKLSLNRQGIWANKLANCLNENVLMDSYHKNVQDRGSNIYHP